MPLTTQQIATLKTELQTDPSALGYAAYIPPTDVDSLIAILMFTRDGSTPCPVNNVVGAVITGVRNANITTQQLLGAIDYRDFFTNGVATAMTVDQTGKMKLFELIAGDGQVSLVNEDGTDNNNLKTLKQCIGNVQNSTNRVTALSKRNGSRLEQLFTLSGIYVNESDLFAALK